MCNESRVLQNKGALAAPVLFVYSTTRLKSWRDRVYMSLWFCLRNRVGLIRSTAAHVYGTKLAEGKGKKVQGGESHDDLREKEQKKFFAFTLLPCFFFLPFPRRTIDLGAGIGDSYLYPRGTKGRANHSCDGMRMEVILSPSASIDVGFHYKGFLYVGHS